MIVIVREGELTEDKKQSCYEYSGLFKIINRVSKLDTGMVDTGTGFMSIGF